MEVHFDLIVEELLEASHTNSFNCAESITRVVHKYLSVKACSFYTYFEDTNWLSLRAQTGFMYSEYNNFELDIQSVAGRSIRTGKLVNSNLELETNFREKKLQEIHQLKSVIAVPLTSSKDAKSFSGVLSQRFFGVLCLYPSGSIDPLLVTRLSKVVGKVYEYSVNQDRSLIRNDIVSNSIRTKDLNSFLHKVLQQMSIKWGTEAASVFIHDDRNNLLSMRATTGVKSDLKLLERAYSLEEKKFQTVNCFINQVVITTTNGNSRTHKFPEILNSNFKSVMYIPIFEPSGTGVNNQKHILGVLRCVNRIVNRGKRHEVCHHGWEDASNLLFVAEIIGIISHVLKRSDEVAMNFERAMHGINRPIHTAKVKIKATQKFMLARGLLESPFDNYLKDSISYLDALEWQVRKHAVRDHYKQINVEKINLFGQVLSKILAFMDDIYHTYNVRSFYRNRIDYTDMPRVSGNEKALQVVFRNIVENAMKYAPEDKKCSIEINWWESDDDLFISIKDNGIGIELKDKDRIFDEGYRSLEAMRLEPTGTGIGLSDSRTIMRNMGGDMYLKSTHMPTEFVTRLRKFKDV